jgi:hypothetical protein
MRRPLLQKQTSDHTTMYTLLYSIAGIAALITISALFSFLGFRRNRIIAKRMTAIRNTWALAPAKLFIPPAKPGSAFVAINHRTRNWKLDPTRNSYDTYPVL